MPAARRAAAISAILRLNITFLQSTFVHRCGKGHLDVNQIDTQNKKPPFEKRFLNELSSIQLTHEIERTVPWFSALATDQYIVKLPARRTRRGTFGVVRVLRRADMEPSLSIAHKQAASNADARSTSEEIMSENKSDRYSHGDPSLRTGEGGLTVWTLQRMAQEEQYDELDKLFNNGLTMAALPVGLAAGTAVPTLGFGSSLIPKVLDNLTIQSKYLEVDSKQFVQNLLCSLAGRVWRGKVFFPSNNKSASEGRNRVRKSLVLPGSPIVPMARFTTLLLDSDPLAPDVTSNVVVLNYAHPETKPYWIEMILNEVQVYDVQVAVRGKYGPIFLGKTWLGTYDKKGQFTALDPGQLTARYFLDFNEGALKEQREEHWDGSEEEFVDPMPRVEN